MIFRNVEKFYSLFHKETHGMEYEVGQSRDVVGYAAGGTTEDFAYLPEPEGIFLKKIVIRKDQL